MPDDMGDGSYGIYPGGYDMPGGGGGGGGSNFTQAGGALGGAIGGLIAEAFNQGDYQKAQALIDQARQGFQDINLPGAAKLNGPSAMMGVTPNGSDAGAQQQALRQLSQYASTGFGPQDQDALNQAMDTAGAFTRGQYGAIADRMAQTGGTGSGADFALQENAAQSGANQMNQVTSAAAGAAANRRLQAVGELGQYSTQLRTQDYTEQAEKAMEEDRVNMRNTDIQNEWQQQNFGDAMARQQAIAGGDYAEATDYYNSARRRSQLASGIGEGVGALGGAGADAYTSGGGGGGMSSLMSMFA